VAGGCMGVCSRLIWNGYIGDLLAASAYITMDLHDSAPLVLA